MPSSRISLALLPVIAACGSGANGPGGNGGCDIHADCFADEICYTGVCEPAFDRKYTIGIESITVGTSFPGGGEWDFGAGAPDLFVCFGFSANDACCTSTNSDAFSATWNEGCSFVVPSGGTFTAEVYDEDLTADDYAGGWVWEGNDALLEITEAVGDTIVTSNNGGMVLKLWSEPEF